MSFHYRKERLAECHWHKVVVGGHSATDLELIKARVKETLPRLKGEAMVKNTGPCLVIMLTEDEDVVLMKMITGFTDEDYRGFGDWSNLKYHNAKNNRIGAK